MAMFKEDSKFWQLWKEKIQPQLNNNIYKQNDNYPMDNIDPTDKWIKYYPE